MDEHQNFEGIDKGRGEPSALDTKIEFDSPERLGQLEAKLEEYRERNSAFSDIQPEEQIDMYGAGRYLPIFKEAILTVVLTLAQDEQRDLERSPVLLPEVAVEVMAATHMDITRAVTTPFVYDEESQQYQPDIEDLWKNGSLADVAFSEAYAILQSYAKGESEGLTGGTGLPGVDSTGAEN